MHTAISKLNFLQEWNLYLATQQIRYNLKLPFLNLLFW